VAVTTLLQPAPDDLLGNAAGVAGGPAAVYICSIEEVAARLDEGVHDREGGAFIRGPAELHRAEAEVRDLETSPAERAKLHAQSVAGDSLGDPKSGERG